MTSDDPPAECPLTCDLVTLEDAQPTEECPRQFTTFRSADGDNCAAFTRCVNGRAYPSACTDGLAFDARTLGCEYADMVESCDATGNRADPRRPRLTPLTPLPTRSAQSEPRLPPTVRASSAGTRCPTPAARATRSA